MALTTKPLSTISTFTRASKAWDYGADGVLVESAVDVLRAGYNPISLSPAGWLLEGSSTNLVRYGQLEGSSGFAQGALQADIPTGWAASASNGGGNDAGLAFTATRATIGGRPCLDLRCFGTASLAGSLRVSFDGTGGPPGVSLTAGQQAALAVDVTLVGGSLTNFGSGLGYYLRATSFPTPIITVPAPTTTLARQVAIFTASGTVSGSAVSWNADYQAGPLDVTVRFALPQFEVNAVASSPILPPVGTPAQTTRAADSYAISGANFTAAFGTGAPAGYLIADVLIDVTTSSNRNVFQLDDGTSNNRIYYRTGGGGSISVGAAVVGGSSTTTSSAGSVTYGSLQRWGMRWANGSVNFYAGGTMQTLSPGPLPAFNTLRIGADTGASTSRLNGRLLGLWGGAFAPTDAKFLAACVYGADVDGAIRS